MEPTSPTPRTALHRGADGFTLAELLVVLAIMGILGAIAVLVVPLFVERADTSACEQDRRTITRAIDSREGGRPASLSDLGDDIDQDAVVGNTFVRRTYTLTYSAGSVSTCQAAMAAGGSARPGGSSSPSASPAAGPSLTGASSADGDGVLEPGDVLTLTFSARVKLSGGATTIVISRANNAAPVLLSVPGVLSGSTALPGAGTAGWFDRNGNRTATFSAAATATGATVKVTVGARAGGSDDTAAGPAGPITFTPSPSVTSDAGTPATGSHRTGADFRMF